LPVSAIIFELFSDISTVKFSHNHAMFKSSELHKIAALRRRCKFNRGGGWEPHAPSGNPEFAAAVRGGDDVLVCFKFHGRSWTRRHPS